MTAVSRFRAVLVLLTLTGCFGLTVPKTFLPTNTPATQTWLTTVVDVDLRNVPLADLPKRGAFAGLTLVFQGVDDEAVVSLEAPQTTRRQALWSLAEKYGLALTLREPLTIVIANRETRRDNLPRN